MKYLILIIICIPQLAFAANFPKAPESMFYGFSLNGEIINPKCVELLQPQISESQESGIILKSLVLESCQNSELAGSGQSPDISEDKTVSFFSDPEDAHTYFYYKVIGKTNENTFVLLHNGYVGLYQIQKSETIPDFMNPKIQSVHDLKIVSRSFVPCFVKGSIKNNKLIIEKKIYNSDAPTAEQCSETLETLEFDLPQSK